MDDFIKRMEFQFDELLDKNPLLSMRFCDNTAIITGVYSIYERLEEYDMELYEDFFDIEIRVEDDFPKSIPKVKELGHRVRSVSYEHINPDGTLCLEVDTKILIDLNKNPTLLYFSEEFIKTYFISFLFFKRHGKFPFGERSHGEDGYLEFYSELFSITNKEAARKLLSLLFNGGLKGHVLCSCDSGRRYRNCHREQINILMESPYKDYYYKDYKLLSKRSSI